MGKSRIRAKVKSASKVKGAVSTAPKVLTKGQRTRKLKRDTQVWKKEVLGNVIRNKTIDSCGVALGTMDALAEAITSEEVIKPSKPTKPKSQGCKKKAALHAQRVKDLEIVNQILAFKPFIDNPLGIIQTHLKNQASK